MLQVRVDGGAGALAESCAESARSRQQLREIKARLLDVQDLAKKQALAIIALQEQLVAEGRVDRITPSGLGEGIQCAAAAHDGLTHFQSLSMESGSTPGEFSHSQSMSGLHGEVLHGDLDSVHTHTPDACDPADTEAVAEVLSDAATGNNEYKQQSMGWVESTGVQIPCNLSLVVESGSNPAEQDSPKVEQLGTNKPYGHHDERARTCIGDEYSDTFDEILDDSLGDSGSPDSRSRSEERL